MDSLPSLPDNFPHPVVIGIDPGSRVMGYGALVLRGAKPVFLAAGTLGMGREGAIGMRLGAMRQDLDELFRKLRPQVVVIERAFAGKNIASALRLGEARGVALCCAAVVGAKIREYTPAEAKKALVGNGRADKTQVAGMVRSALGEAVADLRHDATDALSLALTWAYRKDYEELLERE
ncbi:MAG: crossover junction endodeoxyribonuclease RuvC [Planctomycetota bacterium]|jgi:crossover junction endodeoxyribonuclease RuvC